MKTVGSYQAKTHLPRLLRQVARGERITITRHGVPLGMLVPPPSGKGKGPAPPARERLPRAADSKATDCERELRWLAEHAEEYAGQWVALDGERLLAHGINARDVYAAARRSGVRLPLVVQVEPPDQAPFGGW